MDTPASTASAAPAAPAAPMTTGHAGAAPSTAPTAGASAQPNSTSAAPASVPTTGSPGSPSATGTETATPQSAAGGAPSTPAAGGTPSASPASESAPEPAPAAAQDITITIPDSVPAGMVDQGMLKAYTAMAQDTGITQEQAQKAADWYLQQTQEMQTQNKAANEQYLRQIWGADFGKNMETVRTGLATMDRFMGGDITTQLVNTGLADTAVMARIFHFFGEALAEDSMSSGTPGVGAERVMDREDFVKNVINKSSPRQ